MRQVRTGRRLCWQATVVSGRVGFIFVDDLPLLLTNAIFSTPRSTCSNNGERASARLVPMGSRLITPHLLRQSHRQLEPPKKDDENQCRSSPLSRLWQDVSARE